MDIGPVNRIPALSEPVDVARQPSSAPAAPVRTELPQSKVVTQVETSSAPSTVTRALAKATNVERQVTIDPSTREIVSAVYDKKTGDLVSQVPDRALLRLKAYVREIVSLNEERESARPKVERTA